MPKTIEHCHWPDAPEMWMPYAPAIKARGGTMVYLAGCTAAPVITITRTGRRSSIPCRATWRVRRAPRSPIKRGLEAVGASFADVVTCDRFVTDLSDQDALNRVLGRVLRRHQAGNDDGASGTARHRSALRPEMPRWLR